MAFKFRWTEDTMEDQKTRGLIGIWTAKDRSMRVQLGIGILLKLGQRPCVSFWQKICLCFNPCPNTLGEAKFKGSVIINLVEEISRQPNI